MAKAYALGTGDTAADGALFEGLSGTVVESAERRLVRRPEAINDPAFADALVAQFREVMQAR